MMGRENIRRPSVRDAVVVMIDDKGHNNLNEIDSMLSCVCFAPEAVISPKSMAQAGRSRFGGVLYGKVAVG
jgi:hypothetical protein